MESSKISWVMLGQLAIGKKELLTGTVLVNRELLTGTILVNNFTKINFIPSADT